MKKKVILLIGTLSNGGAERTVSNITLNLPASIDREVILYGRESKIDYAYRGKIKILDHDNPKNTIGKIITLFKRAKRIKEIKKQNPNTYVISFLEYPNLLNVLSGLNHNSIVSVRNFMSTKHNKGIKSIFWNLSIRSLYKKAKNIVVVSKQIKNDLIENYKTPRDKIKVIYNSYPLEEIKGLTKESLTASEQSIFNRPTIITTGRLNKQKGQHHLIRAFKEVKKNTPKAQLVFLGEGDLESYLREQAKEMEIEESVHFFGFQQNPFKYIAQSKVFVMTSYYEGFPNALAEAMACKVPVISSDCSSGPREILAPNENEQLINYENNESRLGYLVPDFNDVDESLVERKIAHSIIDLLNNNNKRNEYAEKAYERVKDFDIKKVINEWSNLITS